MYIAKKSGVSRIILYVLMSVLAAAFLVPLLYVLSISITKESDLVASGYRLIPLHIDFKAYDYIFKAPESIINAYSVTVAVTVAGTILSLLITAMLSYAISRRDFRYRKIVSFIVYFTMLFNGGLVPWYMLISRYLQLKDTLWVLILPCLANAWFVLLLKGFMQSLPPEIFESAKMDGAKEFRIFLQIVLPLSKPGLATVGLFVALMYWNDWWLALLFIDNKNLVPIQLLLNRIMSDLTFFASGLSKNINIDMSQFPGESARMAMCVLAAGPMLIAFPFFQKYFIRGLMVGSIKG